MPIYLFLILVIVQRTLLCASFLSHEKYVEALKYDIEQLKARKVTLVKDYKPLQGKNFNEQLYQKCVNRLNFLRKVLEKYNDVCWKNKILYCTQDCLSKAFDSSKSEDKVVKDLSASYIQYAATADPAYNNVDNDLDQTHHGPTEVHKNFLNQISSRQSHNDDALNIFYVNKNEEALKKPQLLDKKDNSIKSWNILNTNNNPLDANNHGVETKKTTVAIKRSSASCHIL